jgi:hypothetical protein
LVLFKSPFLTLVVSHRKTEVEVHQYCTVNLLSRCRTNHNVGVRVTSLKCAFPGCPKWNRLLNLLFPVENQHPYQLQEIEGQVHNAEIVPHRGMTLAQKEIVRLCIERGQSSPKQVKETITLNHRLLILTPKKTVMWLKCLHYLQADYQRVHQVAAGCGQ